MSPDRLPTTNESPRPHRRKAYAAALLLGLGAYFGSGLYFVQPDERGVVRWLGRVPDGLNKVPPGLHYALPWPFCRVDTPKTTEVRRVFIGLQPGDRQAIARADLDALAASPATDMLTGDVNILKVTLVAQYQVTEPAAYLFTAEDPDRLVQVTIRSVLIDELASLPVDQALTTAKSQLQNETLARSQARLDHYRCGVQLLGATLQAIEPPRAIIDAFKDVVSAKKDAERRIDEAVSETNDILSQAWGQAATIRHEAEAYRLAQANRARGEADRFLSLLAEYRKAPRVTRDRLRLRTFERVLPNVRVYVLDNKPGGKPVNIKIIDTTREFVPVASPPPSPR